jgi:single-stranded-DNA-specific exonuclease
LCQLASGNVKVLDKFRQFLRLATGLATIGTVADVVPLLDENRVLVHFGLKDALINSPPTGIVAIVKHVAMNKKTAKKVLASEDIAFTIAPMLNASGRLNKAEIGIEILITENESRADELAGELYRLNEQRQTIERLMTTEATKMVEEQNQAGATAFVIAKDASDHSWHQGIIGVVAGRIKDRFNRPCVIIARDWTGTNSATGSARSIDEVDLYKALESCSQYLERFGGHPLAAGLRVANDKIDSFRDALCDYVGRTVPKEKLIAELPIDDELPFAAINRELATQIEKMAPFGACNNRPIFCSTSVTQKTKPRYIGDKRGIALQLIQDGVERRAVTFDVHWFADLEECYNKNKKIDVAFLPSVSSYNGETELKLRDWRVAGE